ncbi:MAG: T9SS type A sorting domain-containing protein [Bacteroidota bacterium]
MKKITLIFALILTQTVLLQAQYSGGIGRGDALFESLNILMHAGNASNTLPSSFSLQQNYPDPFNHATTIKCNIAKTTQVKLVVYDITGRGIQTLINECLQPGTYMASFDGSALQSGVFFYKLTAGDYCETRKMMLAKH